MKVVVLQSRIGFFSILCVVYIRPSACVDPDVRRSLVRVSGCIKNASGVSVHVYTAAHVSSLFLSIAKNRTDNNSA